VSITADRTELRVEEAFTLTVRITAEGSVQAPPQRPDLKDLSAYADRFHIESLPPPEGQRPDQATWEFVYRLKPKNTSVDAVPSLQFIYYKPAATPGGRGLYQTQYAQRIPLQVKPAAEVVLPAPPEGVALPEVPESVLRLVEGERVLRRPVPWGVPLLVAAALVLPGVPAICFLWYAFWRRCYPDADRLARQRRSQAARQALKTLETAARQPADEQARTAAGVVVNYLRHRLDLQVVDATPHEAARHLSGCGILPETAEKVERFLEDCDAARFAPVADATAGGRSTSASQLILELEGEMCPPS
jgi:hypothetical protein